MAMLSMPSSLILSIHLQRPSGSLELALLYGIEGMRLVLPLKITFLCRLPMFGVEAVYS